MKIEEQIDMIQEWETALDWPEAYDSPKVRRLLQDARKNMEKLLATLKDVQKLSGDCYQGASEREPILVIAQIWEAANEALAATKTTEKTPEESNWEDEGGTV